MSTEEQSNPNNPDTEVSGDRSINIKLNKTHNIANQQAEQADKQRRNLFRSLNDAINTHHFRQLVRDPRAWVEIIALIVLICYTRYAGQQSETMNNTLVEIRKQTGFAEKASKAAIDAAGIAQDALTMARDNFRQDQRPYIWLAGPKGPPYQAELLVTGEKAGHVAVTFSFTNYGKSPAIDVREDLHLGIGPDAIKEIRRYPVAQTYGSVVPPGEMPQATIYSDGIVTSAIFDSIHSGTVPLIMFGHFEYTDMIEKPPITYKSEFCFGIGRNLGAVSGCVGHNSIR